MSIGFSLSENVKEASFSVKVIRADGSIEDLGIIAYYSSNIFKNIWWKLKNYLKGYYN
jgi:hypothetical protein